MKSLSWEHEEATSNVQRPTSNVRNAAARASRRLTLLLDEADVAAAFEARGFDLGEVFRLGVEAQVFLEIVLGDRVRAAFRFQSISPSRTSVYGVCL